MGRVSLCYSTVLLHGLSGNFKAAVEMALGHGDLALAKRTAWRPTDEDVRKKLFRIILQSEAARLFPSTTSAPPVSQREKTAASVQADPSVQAADLPDLESRKAEFLGLIAESQLSVRDVLPFLKDPALVDCFTEQIASYLEQCEGAIASLRKDMRDHRAAAALLKEDLARVEARSIEVLSTRRIFFHSSFTGVV